MGRLDERSKVLQHKLDRYARTGENAATDRAKRKAAKKAFKEKCRPFQKRLNKWHAAWVAAGMPKDFPNMEQWEAERCTS